LPSGANGVFSTSSGTPTFPSTLTVNLQAGTPTGTYTLVVHGTGGGLERVANAVLSVTAATTETHSPSQTVTTGTTSGLLEAIQQNSLLIIAALIGLAVVLGLLAMRGRGQPRAPQQTAPSRIFCGKCGTENSASYEFCRNCGNKLEIS
jgi:hypothetical protein